VHTNHHLQTACRNAGASLIFIKQKCFSGEGSVFQRSAAVLRSLFPNSP
jgi:hypothetical protein